MERMETEITETNRQHTEKRIRKYGDILVQECGKKQNHMKEGGRK